MRIRLRPRQSFIHAERRAGGENRRKLEFLNMSLQNWNYDGNFMESFETPRRSLVSNMFCNAVRRGCATAAEVVRFVRADALARLDMRDGYYPGEENIIRALRILISVLETGEALRYAEFIIKRESLSFEEKSALKRESGV